MVEAYGELRRLAQTYLARERLGHTLQATALVHEAWLRMGQDEAARSASREQFLALASRAMRRVLVDHARAKGTAKRTAGGQRVELNETVAGYEERGLDLLVVDDALERLGRLDARLVQVVELLYFGGLTAAEAARVLGCTSRTVERDWQFAKAWLNGRLAEGEDAG